MTRGRGSKGRKTAVNQPENTAQDEAENALADLEMEEEGGHETTCFELADSEAGMRSGLANISKDIKDLKTEMKASFRAFGEDLRRDVKRDLDDFKKGINQEFSKLGTEQQLQSGRLNEAETRLEKLESWALEANNALITSLKEQKTLQDKLTDLESRSRRNNLRIYGVPEGEEGESTAKFLQDMLRRELQLPDDLNLQIQRAHRSLAPKPAAGAQPRPIIVNFLEFTTKERVLRDAWKTKIQLRNKLLSFDHDYATEVVQKRKEYNASKRVLKEKGIRFQTPFTRMRVHWSTGARTYNDAREVKEELVKRGLIEPTPARDTEETGLETRLSAAMEWQRREGPRRSTASATTMATTRARDKLQEFRRSGD